MSEDIDPKEWAALNAATVARQLHEIQVLKAAIRAELIAAAQGTPDGGGWAGPLVLRALSSLGHAYELGRSHRSEELRSRLAVDAEQTVTVIVWHDEECPAQPHAHLRFTAGSGPSAASASDRHN